MIYKLKIDIALVTTGILNHFIYDHHIDNLMKFQDVTIYAPETQLLLYWITGNRNLVQFHSYN